jgi:uncharacterized NAD-dependent epimerase/dehydratase family protein
MSDTLDRTRRYAVLTEGYLADHTACKTAYGVIRFLPEQIAAVVDSQFSGKRVCDVVEALHSDAPIVATVPEALDLGATSLLIGVATHGGMLPPALREFVLTAIDNGLEIVNGLHEFLADDPQFAAGARASGARIWDVRAVPKPAIFSGAVYDVRRQIVLAVGSDCSVGKMTAMLELQRSAIGAGTKAQFIATGQTGIIIAGWGACVDGVISDFVTGAAEQLVLGASPQSEVLLVEGQGSIFHPAYAPVTFGLLYGSAPDALVLCHRPNMAHIDGFSTAVPSLQTLVAMHESILAHVKPARVAAIAMDTSALDAAAAAAEVANAEWETGLTADDPVRNGGRKLWEAIAAALSRTPKAALSARA